MVHGRAAAEKAAETARKTFEEGRLGEELPTVEVPRAELEQGLGLLRAMVLAGLAKSNGEARRAVQGGAVRVNGEKVSDERMVLTTAHVNENGVIKLSFGKKRHALLRPV